MRRQNHQAAVIVYLMSGNSEEWLLVTSFSSLKPRCDITVTSPLVMHFNFIGIPFFRVMVRKEEI